MSDLSRFFLRKIHFTYSLVTMFIFLSTVLALSNNSDSLTFALSFVFFFVLSDLLERGMNHKRLPIALSSLLLTGGIFLFLIGYSDKVIFHYKTVINLALFYITLIFSVSYRLSTRNPFFGLRTYFTYSSDEAWQVTHEVASKLLFFSLIFYLVVLALSDHILFHLAFFTTNILINAVTSIWLAKQFLKK